MNFSARTYPIRIIESRTSLPLLTTIDAIYLFFLFPLFFSFDEIDGCHGSRDA